MKKQRIYRHEKCENVGSVLNGNYMQIGTYKDQPNSTSTVASTAPSDVIIVLISALGFFVSKRQEHRASSTFPEGLCSTFFSFLSFTCIFYASVLIED